MSALLSDAQALCLMALGAGSAVLWVWASIKHQVKKWEAGRVDEAKARAIEHAAVDWVRSYKARLKAEGRRATMVDLRRMETVLLRAQAQVRQR